MEYKISVLVPVYGVEMYIERCARSLFAQTMDEVEYIFVDDKTKDKSIEILKSVLEEFPKRKTDVRIISHERNKGLSEARNTALKASCGEYIMHVDSDDYLALDALSKMYEMAKQQSADIVIADIMEVYGTKMTYHSLSYSADKEKYLSLLLCLKANASIVGKLMKRSLLIDKELFSISNISMGEDYVLYPRVVYYASKICKLDKFIYFYVQNKSSLTHTFKLKDLDDLYLVENILQDFFSKHKIVSDEILLKSIIVNKMNMYYMAPLNLYKAINAYHRNLKYNDLRLPLYIKIILFFSLYDCSIFIYAMCFIRNLLRKKINS